MPHPVESASVIGRYLIRAGSKKLISIRKDRPCTGAMTRELASGKLAELVGEAGKLCLEASDICGFALLGQIGHGQAQVVGIGRI